MWLIPIVLIIIVIYFLKENSKGEAEDFSAQDVLNKRNASGEIDKEEYQEKSNVLKKNI